MRRLACLAATAAAAAVLAGGAGATDPGRFSGTFTFADTLCGFTGTNTVLVNDNFGSLPDGASYDAGRLIETFEGSCRASEACCSS